MKKRPFSFFLELLFVLFFFLITSTALIEIYAKMMQVSKEDTYRQEAMIIAQNEIETHTRVGDYTRKMNDTDYDIKIRFILINQFMYFNLSLIICFFIRIATIDLFMHLINFVC